LTGSFTSNNFFNLLAVDGRGGLVVEGNIPIPNIFCYLESDEINA
jgi:hypothetical protein